MTIDYSKLTIPELKKKCKEFGISGYSNKKKAEIIELLEERSDDTDNDTDNENEIIENEIIDNNNENSISLKPLVKWSGGKYDEIEKFKKYIPDNYNYYIEPFVGGGSVFFYLNPQKAIINDIHKELIAFYKAIQENQANDIYEFMLVNPNEEEIYYNIRDDMEINDNLDEAKRFYYLRKTCYRGMLRYNKSGKFNIPFGKYKSINFEDLKNENYTTLLSRTEIYNTSFEEIFNISDNENNFMLLDPPYDSTFTDYGYCSFGKEEHKKLAELFKTTKCKCLMIIGKTDFITELYKDYIVEEYKKNYRFRLHSGRVKKDDIDTMHLVIKNY